jgi:hypothetical protein
MLKRLGVEDLPATRLHLWPRMSRGVEIWTGVGIFHRLRSCGVPGLICTSERATHREKASLWSVASDNSLKQVVNLLRQIEIAVETAPAPPPTVNLGAEIASSR